MGFLRLARPRSLVLAVILAVATLLATATPASAMRGVAGVETWADNTTPITGSYGVSADILTFPRPAYGNKVNSVYVQYAPDPANYGVEVGYVSTGDHPLEFGDYGAPDANMNPRFFCVMMRDGHFYMKNFDYAKALTLNQRYSMSIKNTTSNDNFDFYLDGVKQATFYDAAFSYGSPVMGSEHEALASDPDIPSFSASFTGIDYLDRDGWTYTWVVCSHGKPLNSIGSLRWRFNHIADWNHWAYVSYSDI